MIIVVTFDEKIFTILPQMSIKASHNTKICLAQHFGERRIKHIHGRSLNFIKVFFFKAHLCI